MKVSGHQENLAQLPDNCQGVKEPQILPDATEVKTREFLMGCQYSVARYLSADGIQDKPRDLVFPALL
jgi:hypothetical protein